MALIYLEPNDLTAAQAARVLDFLNRATSAHEIASRIEFAGELDVGERLGQGLLDARAALGGSFADLTQIHAARLIGPERFTELCAAILGLDLSRWAAEFGLFADRQQDLVDRCAQLQAQFDALGSAPDHVQLGITCQPQPSWLGMTLNVVVTARDIRGRPLPNRFLTIEASTGNLEAARGFTVQHASAVQLRSGADGTVRLALRHANIEPLTADQQAALEEVLAQLDPAADSPHQLREAFLSIADQYQQERRHSLRAALDIFGREWKADFFDRLNPSDLGFRWPVETSVLRAYGHPETHPARVVGQAVLAVHWKNWVGAWFEFLGEYLATRAGLQQGFADAKQRGAQGYRLVDNLVGQAHSFVAAQKGLAAEWLSQRVVKYALHDFLGKELADVDAATQRELFSHLDIAAEQITPANRGAIALVNQTRVDLNNNISKINLGNLDLLDKIRDVHSEVLARAQQVEKLHTDFSTRFATFSNNFTALTRDYSQFVSNFATFSANYTTFNTDYSAFRNDYGTFRNNYGSFQTDYSAFKIDYGKFQIDNRAFTTNFATFNTSYTNFTRDSATLSRDIGVVRGELTQFRTDRTQLIQAVDVVKTDMVTVKQNITNLSAHPILRRGGG